MDSNSVSPMPELAPIAEFDKSPPSPPNEEVPMDDLPPPPATVLPDVNKKKIQRSRSYESDDGERGACSWCEYAIIITLATILLIGVSALTIFWVMYYREGYAWNDEPKKQFNLHPTLMVAGFITLSGFSVLLYRICRCFRRIYVKLLHAIFHALAFPCIVVGFLSVYDYHNLSDPPIANFYSLHSWIGFVAMGLFGIQYVVGFFSFLLLLICSKGTAGFRASLVPIHASFGILTFMLGVCACLTGLTEKAIFTLGARYQNLPDEGVIVNAIGVAIIAILAVVIYILTRSKFRASTEATGNLIRASVDL